LTASRTEAPVGVLGVVRAMASDITLFGHSADDPSASDPTVDQALAVFTSVHEACTRFDPDSPLMRANARPGEWHTVPLVLLAAVREAHRAYLHSDGRFDPRVFDDLVRLGYDRSLPFNAGGVTTDAVHTPRGPLPRWTPQFHYGPRPELHLGGVPIDLGGIGKSLAVRWASEELQEHFDDFLLDAGGDCYCEGTGTEQDGWRVGVEDPFGGELPLAVLALSDKGCATSSTKLRHWRAGGRDAHHLIDPTTGRPGGDGLVAVTVVDDDPTRAEVATKYLFLGGADEIAQAAQTRRVAALWVSDEGEIATSPAMEPFIIWRAG
jgi:thiamine biosynthesis lipoprotein